MKKFFLFYLLCSIAISAYSQINDESISFIIRSGDSQTYTENELVGKTTMFFYETKETAFVNKDLKKALSEHYNQIKESHPDISLLAVANCTSAEWPFIGIWEKGLIKKSKSEGHTVYGDWDGNICRRFSLEPDESNFLILNREGKVLYQNSGYISDTEIQEILNLLILETGKSS